MPSAAGGNSRLALKRTRYAGALPGPLAHAPSARSGAAMSGAGLSRIGNSRSLLGRVGGLQGVEEKEAILADRLGIGLAFGLVLGQTGLLDPPAIALVPRQRGQGLEPVGRDRGHRVQRGAEGFRHEFEPVQHADRGEHVRRVGTLLSPGGEQAQRPAALQQLVEEELFGAARQQAVPEFAQDRKVETQDPSARDSADTSSRCARGPPPPPGDRRGSPETA